MIIFRTLLIWEARFRCTRSYGIRMQFHSSLEKISGRSTFYAEPTAAAFSHFFSFFLWYYIIPFLAKHFTAKMRKRTQTSFTVTEYELSICNFPIAPPSGKLDIIENEKWPRDSELCETLAFPQSIYTHIQKFSNFYDPTIPFRRRMSLFLYFMIL